MNGGAWERVAGYLDNGNNNLNKYGNSTSDSKIQYYAPYDDKQNRGWFMTAEEPAKDKDINQKYARAWDSDGVLIGHVAAPFILRGGVFHYIDTAGILCTSFTYGLANNYAYSTVGFRPVLVL